MNTNVVYPKIQLDHRFRIIETLFTHKCQLKLQNNRMSSRMHGKRQHRRQFVNENFGIKYLQVTETKIIFSVVSDRSKETPPAVRMQKLPRMNTVSQNSELHESWKTAPIHKCKLSTPIQRINQILLFLINSEKTKENKKIHNASITGCQA